MQISGQCHCGAISFTALIDPAKIIAYHCQDRQTFSGAPFRAVAPTPVENVKMTGQPKHYVKTAVPKVFAVNAAPSCTLPSQTLPKSWACA